MFTATTRVTLSWPLVDQVDDKFPVFRERRTFTYSVPNSLPPLPILSQANAAPQPHILFIYS